MKLGAPARTDFAALGRAVEASLLSERLSDFAKGAWHVLEPQTPLKWGWALDAICEHLEAVTAGHVTRLLVNVPPGCMKSLLTSVLWPAWEWTRPGLRGTRFIGTSHKQDLAVRDNLKCRRLIQSRWYQARWPVAIVSDQNAKTKFENSDTGWREAMAFANMTGSRGDRVIVDDPIGVDDSNSEAILLTTERTVLETLPSRVNNDASAIVFIMQRTHERDPSGVLLDKGLGYVHLRLPMEFELEHRCRTVIGFVDPRRTEGELLFPERFSATNVANLKLSLGEYGTAGQLQQRPTPRGGGMFKTKFLQLWPAGQLLPDFEYIVQSYDTAFTEKTAADDTACTVWGVFRAGPKRLPRAMLLDAWNEKMTYPRLRRKVLADWGAEYGGVPDDLRHPSRRADEILVENKGSGISLIQDLNAANVPAYSYNPGNADKFARANAVLPLYELGLFYVLESSKKSDAGQPVTWARPFVKQLGQFGPGVTAKDDYVDTFTQAALLLRDKNLLHIPFYTDDAPQTRDYAAVRKVNPYDG